jgi:hypothetical protein
LGAGRATKKIRFRLSNKVSDSSPRVVAQPPAGFQRDRRGRPRHPRTSRLSSSQRHIHLYFRGRGFDMATSTAVPTPDPEPQGMPTSQRGITGRPHRIANHQSLPPNSVARRRGNQGVIFALHTKGNYELHTAQVSRGNAPSVPVLRPYRRHEHGGTHCDHARSLGNGNALFPWFLTLVGR